MRTIEDVQECFEHWKLSHDHPRARLDEKRRLAISGRLHNGYSVQDIKDAIDGCKLSTFHMGENKERRTYDDIELICRDSKHIDEFIKLFEENRKKGERRRAEMKKREAEDEELERERAARTGRVVDIVKKKPGG